MKMKLINMLGGTINRKIGGTINKMIGGTMDQPIIKGVSNMQQYIGGYTSEQYMGLWVLGICLFLIIVIIGVYFYYSTLESRECNNMKSIYGELNGKIVSIDTSSESSQYTLKDYYIKSAYNCCNGGNYKNDYVNICNLKALLKQGIRGLDFELFSINDQPVIASSTSDNYYVKETFNYVPFSDFINVINTYAFTNTGSPNPADPILLHFRMKSQNKKMYQNLAKILESYENRLLGSNYSFENQGKNLGDVPLTSLLQKIIIIVDKKNTTYLEVPEFYEYVNLTSDSVFMRALHYYDIKYTPDMTELIDYNKQNMTIGMPDSGYNPENPSSMIMREMGVQMLAMRYQNIDSNIEENDAFFNDNRSAFVLKPENLRYKPVTVEEPEPQNPELSYATRIVQSDFYKFDI